MILVTGASGYIGKRVLDSLLRQDFPVTGMVRDPAGMPSEMSLRIADYNDPESLLQAFEGVSTLVFISSDGHDQDVQRHHANVIEAASAQKIPSVVFTSIIDVDDGSPFYFAPVYRDSERRLRESGMAWTFLRCGLYSDLVLDYWIKPALSSGVISLPTGEGRIAPITRDDVATAVASTVMSVTKHAGKTCELTGSQALSFGRIAKAASTAFGVPLEFASCTSEDYFRRAQAEMDDPWPHAFTTMCQSIMQGRYERISDAYQDITGRSPADFGRFIQRAAL